MASYNSTNNHYYELLSQPASWAGAFAIASASSYRGLYGYLATVTSAQENSFLQSLNAANPVSQNYIWLGGTDNQVEGTWKWTGGPEQGSTFFQAGNSALNANNYGNWNSDPQPNVWSSGEDYLVFYASHHSDPYGSAGSWTDSQDYTIAGTVENGMKPFFIEYGGLTPTYTISASSSSVNEGSSVTFSVNTVNVEWGTVITYTITGIGQSDLASGSLTGTATVNQNGVDGRATVTVNLANDQITEGAETLTLTVSGQQSVVTIQDTSITPAPQGGGSTNVVTPICFARGTLIHITGEAIPVESLATGSTVQSQVGGIAQCRWIGYQRRTPEFAQFQDYLPVKISAGAVDDHVPIRDLYLSPDHAVLIDGHLIHAKALVNGKTIVQMTEWAGDIEYYHIETEAHEIIYAEGVPCETFIDNVSREQFDNYAEYQALYPNTRMMKELPLPRVKFKRQLPLAIKQRLESRISELDRQHKV